VLNPSHDVLAEVPPENLIQMAEIGRTHGRYPIKRSFTDEELLQI
jgi:hypothetical protein